MPKTWGGLGLEQEVTVVGAGPAGCLLAIYLLRRGFSVNLFEKREATLAQPGSWLCMSNPPFELHLPPAALFHLLWEKQKLQKPFEDKLWMLVTWGEGTGDLLRNSYSYSMVLASRGTKALQGAGLALPLTLLNPLAGSCRHLANGTMVMFPPSHPVTEISWITKKTCVHCFVL